MCLVIGLAAATPSDGRAAHSYVIHASVRSIEIGEYQALGGSRLPTYAKAIQAFGTPQSCVLRPFGKTGPPASNYSRVIWRTLGVTADFITYGVIPNGGDACSAPSGVQLDTLRITSEKWRTSLGLRVGSTVATLQHLYSHALPHGHTFWLITGRNVVGTASLYPIFSATISHGHVSSLAFKIGAQGD